MLIVMQENAAESTIENVVKFIKQRKKKESEEQNKS